MVRDGGVDPVAAILLLADHARRDELLEHVEGLRSAEGDERRGRRRDRHARRAPSEENDDEDRGRRRELKEARLAETEFARGVPQCGPKGCGRRRPEDDLVLVRREEEQRDERSAPTHRTDDPRSHVPAHREPRSAPDREEGYDVEEVAILDELLRREAEVEGGDLEHEQGAENDGDSREWVRVSALAMHGRRHQPRGGEHRRQDADAEHHLVEVRSRRAPEARGHEVALERDDVVADDAAEPAGRREQHREHSADQVCPDEDPVPADGLPQRGPNVLLAAVATGVARLVEDDGERQRKRDHEELCPREEGEREARERRHVAPATRMRDRPLAEKDAPGERRIRSVLGQEGRREDEPGRDRRERRGHVTRRIRAGYGACEVEGGYRGAHQQHDVEHVRDGRRVGRWERPVERGQEERVELAVGRVVRPVDGRDERQVLGDARRQAGDLQLVCHHRPGVHAQRVVRRDPGGDENGRHREQTGRSQEEGRACPRDGGSLGTDARCRVLDDGRAVPASRAFQSSSARL